VKTCSIPLDQDYPEIGIHEILAYWLEHDINATVPKPTCSSDASLQMMATHLREDLGVKCPI
jgi:hypothetical protein